MKFILKGCKEGLSKVTKIRNFMKFTKNCEIYDNLPAHPGNIRNLFKGLQGSAQQ